MTQIDDTEFWDLLSEFVGEDVVTQSDTEGVGNIELSHAIVTTPSESKKALGKIRARWWLWTFNNYSPEDKSLMLAWCKKNCTDYVFQEEKGDVKETPHLQGFWQFTNARTKLSLVNKWPKCWMAPSNNIDACRAYAGKLASRSGEKFDKKKCKDPLNGKILRPFQKKISDMIIGEPDDRKIFWFWDEDGGKGKTVLAKSLCCQYDNIIYVEGSANDVKSGVTDWIAEDGKELGTVIYAVPRGGSVDYRALENVKDGIFYNTKYKSKMLMYDSPHVVVLANFAPDERNLSKDRWVVEKIEEVAEGGLV